MKNLFKQISFYEEDEDLWDPLTVKINKAMFANYFTEFMTEEILKDFTLL
jgi:hypothetical protein